MLARDIYKKETGKDISADRVSYYEWLKKMVELRYEPGILKWIQQMFVHTEQRQWYETYWAIDVHGTITIPDYRKVIKSVEYYPYAKETLQLMSSREDMILIMTTSSYPDEIEVYNEQFKKDGILFKYINENPDISSDSGSFGYYINKYYFNVLIDDKAGFNPSRDWQFLYNYFSTTKFRPNKDWNMKFKETYHKAEE